MLVLSVEGRHVIDVAHMLINMWMRTHIHTFTSKLFCTTDMTPSILLLQVKALSFGGATGGGLWPPWSALLLSITACPLLRTVTLCGP
jgi:hypothetical protein